MQQIDKMHMILCNNVLSVHKFSMLSSSLVTLLSPVHSQNKLSSSAAETKWSSLRLSEPTLWTTGLSARWAAAAKSSSGGGVTSRGTREGQAGGTALVEEVGVFSRETTAHNLPYQHCCWLFVLHNNHKKNTGAPGATHSTVCMLD